jgi:type II secretory ATPase GspE/PulE/Tfp pilus assembly ATPase PilB-like protein
LTTLTYPPVPTTTPSDIEAPPGASATDSPLQGPVEAVLDDRSVVRGILQPFRASDALVEVAMQVGGGVPRPLRIKRESLRALKLSGWPDTPFTESAPMPFRFEFDDAQALTGECVWATMDAHGAWLRVVRADGAKEFWFVDGRDCLRATLDGAPLAARPASFRRNAPARPESPDALWRLISKRQSSRDRGWTLPEALVRGGWIDQAALQRARAAWTQSGEPPPLERVLVETGVISEERLRMARAEWMGLCVIDPRGLECEPAALALLPPTLADRCQGLPLSLRGDALAVLVADPSDQAVLDELRFITQKRVIPVMAMPGTLPSMVRGDCGAATGAGAASDRVGASSDARTLADALMTAPEASSDRSADVVTEADSALVRLVNSVIAEAIARRASDIHVETADAPRHVRIRLRIDGEMLPFVELPARLRFAVVARLKIMAELDISEHRRPQDGKIDFARFGGPHVELRVVTVPTSHGLEDVVLRLLGGLRPRPLEEIDLTAANLADLRAAARKPYGLILICGPTGCGKTTTLHSVMRELNTDARKIWTAEDPIEITQEGLRQVQTNAQIGWTFAAAMRTFLRADPDVIMIGEMRDEETAHIAIEASLTGHLVLSTLHTNSAPESITRLLEIGLDPFTFSDSLLAILAQRLVRRLCVDCRKTVILDEAELDAMARHAVAGDVDPARLASMKERWRSLHGDEQGQIRIFRRHGCRACDGHGYRGRLAIHELMLASEAIRMHIRRRDAASALQATALAAGMRTLRQDGIDKVLAGLTDLSEVLSATQS